MSENTVGNKNSLKKCFTAGTVIAVISFIIIAGMTKAVPSRTIDISRLTPLEGFSAEVYFPLQEGNYWEYAGQHRECNDGAKIETKKLAVRMLVKKRYHCTNYSLAVMTGNPWKADPQEKYGLLTYSNQIYYVSPELLTGLIKAAESDSILPSDQELNLKLEMPLYNGQRFVSTACPRFMTRSDQLYVPSVSRLSSSLLSDATIPSHMPVYSISDSSCGDSYNFEFVPTVGVTGVSYAHNGTIYEYQLKLKGYKVGS